MGKQNPKEVEETFENTEVSVCGMMWTRPHDDQKFVVLKRVDVRFGPTLFGDRVDTDDDLFVDECTLNGDTFVPGPTHGRTQEITLTDVDVTVFGYEDEGIRYVKIEQ